MHLRKIEIANFSCLQNVTVEFTDLHALIGPNDSGKSTILRAVKLLTQMLARAAQAKDTGTDPNDTAFDPASGSRLRGWYDPLSFDVAANPGPSFTINLELPGNHFSEERKGSLALAGFFKRRSPLDQIIARHPNLSARLAQTCLLLRLDPDMLRMESGLIPDNQVVTFHNDDTGGMRGQMLPAIYDAIMNRGDDSFAKINERVRDLFATIRNIRLITPSRNGKCIACTLTDGTTVPASQMSEGLLYFLAYAALPYLSQPSILLVEEPENGLHPSRIRDVMNILREISKTTQVIIATHSPLVLNELRSEEITVVTRDTEKGTQARKLSESFDHEVRSKVYLPGELWLNYANGVDEADLFNPGKTEL